MFIPKGNPLIKLFHRDRKAFTESHSGVQPHEVFSQCTKDKEKTISGVGDDEVRKDSMSMPAATTEDPCDTQVILSRSSIPEVNDVSAVIRMDPASAVGITDRTGLEFSPETEHKGIKHRFR